MTRTKKRKKRTKKRRRKKKRKKKWKIMVGYKTHGLDSMPLLDL